VVFACPVCIPASSGNSLASPCSRKQNKVGPQRAAFYVCRSETAEVALTVFPYHLCILQKFLQPTTNATTAATFLKVVRRHPRARPKASLRRSKNSKM
jgi:hypothetical protein